MDWAWLMMSDAKRETTKHNAMHISGIVLFLCICVFSFLICP
jgi:hypothetical protein